MTTISDQSLQSKVEAVNSAAAIAWSKQLAWVDFTVVVASADISTQRRLIERKTRLAALSAAPANAPVITHEIMHGNSHGSTMDAPNEVVSASTTEGVTNATEIVAVQADITRLEALLTTLPTITQAGLVAQQVQALIVSTGYGAFVVTNSHGILSIDYTAVMAIVNQGFQLRLAVIEAFLSTVDGSGVTV